MEFRWRFFTIVILVLSVCLTSICAETPMKSPGGPPSTNVSNFKCRGYDYAYMTCEFTVPVNKGSVDYNLTYKAYYFMNSHSVDGKCDLQSTGYNRYCKLINADKSTSMYFINRPIYVFSLSETNITQEFTINHFDSVIPAKIDISLKNITSDSVSLYWNIDKYMYYEKQGLEYEIRLKPKGFEWYYATDYEQCKEKACNVTIKNLTYPYREYIVMVRVKVKTALNDGSMWSEPYNGAFRTKPRRPDSPPKTAVGSFYIDSDEKSVRLYWQQLTEYEENGPDFHYVINKTYLNGTQIETSSTKEAKITFAWNRSDNYNYFIKSRNKEGESDKSTQILVHPVVEDEFFPKTIKKFYHNRIHTIFWEPPKNQTDLLNYTVFWCLPKMALNSECKGTIHFEYIDTNATNFTTKPQDHDDSINLAVSANYRNSFTGMQWASGCSSNLIKLEPVAIPESATTIKVRWSSERVCTTMLKGYNLTYCQVPENASSTQANCLNSDVHTESLPVQQEYAIENLRPYSNYRIDLLMYSNHHSVGPRSDPIYVRTEEGAPSSPRNLQVIESSITSNSANLSWRPPLEENGEIKGYTIWFIKMTPNKGHKDCKTLHKNKTNIRTDGRIYFKLISLSSFSKYEVYITAHTKEISEKSNSIILQTLIATPTNPRNVSLTEEGSYGILKWETPEMPSGRVDFYEVALIIKYKNKEEEAQQISLVNGKRCKFRFPVCVDAIKHYYLKVRAVNAAEKHEIDHRTFPNIKLNQRRRRRRHSNPKISANVASGLQTYGPDDTHNDVDTKYIGEQKIPTQLKDNSIKYNDDDSLEQSKFHCLDTESPLDVKYASYKKHLNDVDDIKYFPSTWKESTNYTNCFTENKFSKAIAIVVPVIMITAFLAFIFYWLRKKFNEMKDLNPLLPVELLTQMPNYQFGIKAVEKDCSSNASRSNDCLVAHKESHYLLSSICNGSINGTNPVVTHKNVNDIKDSQSKEVTLPSNICIEEQIEMNDIYELSSDDSTPTDIYLDLQNETPALENVVTFSDGYNKPLAMISSDLTHNRLLATSAGYVLPAHVQMPLPQHEHIFNGYTTLDAMGKCILPKSMETVSSTPKLNEKNSEHKEAPRKEPDIESILVDNRPIHQPIVTTITIVI